MTESIDLGLQLPLSGVQLIEASAGTGKTFTVATLYTRLVIEAALPVSRLLAVTYTEAASKDLRDKLRERLARASALLEAEGEGVTTAQAGDAEPEQLSRLLLGAALAREALPALRQRLRVALAQMDLAPIHTIHAFCQRALREHALEAGQPLAPRELLSNEASLRREVATEFWRRCARVDSEIEALIALWKSPEKLAEALPELLALDALEPAPPADDGGASLAQLRAARLALAEAFLLHGEHARELLRSACAQAQVHATYSKDSAVDPVWQALRDWSPTPARGDPLHRNLKNYGQSTLQLRTNKGKTTPVSPLFAAIDAWQAAVDAHALVRQGAELAIVHAACGFAHMRLAQLKRERGLLGFDDMIRDVAAALEGPGGERFARALQAQYAIALVDEFQDTDPRQWAIFRRLFAQPGKADGDTPRALFLIGDPKQAIYRFRGGDVATYLAAKAEAAGPYRLTRNFRSRPLALKATETLFGLHGPGAFDQAGIEFEPVQPGGACLDGHFLLDDAIAPALFVQELGEVAGGIEEVRSQATSNCVVAIHELLAKARAGKAVLHARGRDGQLRARAVEPGDISVLVARNDDALRMQRALSEAGIPSVAAGRSSLYASAEASDLCGWLAALAAPADDGRLRALLASPLFGLDAAAIAAFDTELERHRHWQDQAQGWLLRARRHGAMAALGGVCAQQAPRLLAQSGGERRLSNYLQLAEELQSAETGATGIAALLAELERRIEDADSRNDAEQLRLESDSARVRIMTMHVSKGLNLDLVFLPYAATGGRTRPVSKPVIARRHEGLRRIGRLVADGKDPACAEDRHEDAAERIRVLYVALTRARFATWIGWGACNDCEKTALAWLLHRGQDEGVGKKLEAQDYEGALQELLERAPGAIVRLPPADPAQLEALPRLRFAGPEDLPAARTVHRTLERDWWVYSFSQLAREESGAEERGAEDEAPPSPLQRSRFSGTRFGNALHGALEKLRFADWLDSRSLLPPTGQLDPVQEALRREGFASQADLDEGVPILTFMISETLNAPMPEGTRLAMLAPEAMCVEMEFHFQLAPVTVTALLALLHAHGLVGERRGFGLRQRLEGLLTGRIDLVYEAGGRYFVLDYKSNQLPDYDADTLARAVRDSEYDLQYLLYTLALHRWLRFRLGAGYDIARHLGGVRYLFCRGLDRDDPQSPGVHALRLPDALVLALDALLQQREAA